VGELVELERMRNHMRKWEQDQDKIMHYFSKGE